MVNLALVLVLVAVLGAPFHIGMYVVYVHYAGRAGKSERLPTTTNAVYRRGVELARRPTLLLFLPFALVTVVLGLFVVGTEGPYYSGGLPSKLVALGRVGGGLLGLAVYVGGLTVAGSVLSVYAHARRAGTLR